MTLFLLPDVCFFWPLLLHSTGYNTTHHWAWSERDMIHIILRIWYIHIIMVILSLHFSVKWKDKRLIFRNIYCLHSNSDIIIFLCFLFQTDNVLTLKNLYECDGSILYPHEKENKLKFINIVPCLLTKGITRQNSGYRIQEVMNWLL